MGNTKISWATKVWNITTGCKPVSAGCAKCYAHRMADRFWATQYPPNADGTPRKFTDVRCHDDRLDEPMHWKKPARIFVDSVSDLFHKDVPDGFIFGVFMRMAYCRIHTFLILTKRPARMLSWITKNWMTDCDGNYHDELTLSNVYLGVSVEDQQTADERIPLLLQIPAAKHFISYEPALAAVDFGEFQPFKLLQGGLRGLSGVLSGRIDQVIQGCESGPGARPMDIEWARSVRDQCKASGTAFFLKQMCVDGKLVKMPLLDGHVYAEFPKL
jgi:protein gp37